MGVRGFNWGLDFSVIFDKFEITLENRLKYGRDARSAAKAGCMKSRSCRTLAVTTLWCVCRQPRFETGGQVLGSKVVTMLMKPPTRTRREAY